MGRSWRFWERGEGAWWRKWKSEMTGNIFEERSNREKMASKEWYLGTAVHDTIENYLRIDNENPVINRRN